MLESFGNMFEKLKESFENKPHMQAPRPNLGGCTNTGEWSDPSMVDKCLECVGVPGYYGEKQFYCAGKCMSEYNTAQHCSTSSLVAKQESQCSAPCHQEGAPALRGCSDKFDCNQGMDCVSGKCVKSKEGYGGDFDYALNMSSSKNDFYGKDKIYIGVL